MKQLNIPLLYIQDGRNLFFFHVIISDWKFQFSGVRGCRVPNDHAKIQGPFSLFWHHSSQLLAFLIKEDYGLIYILALGKGKWKEITGNNFLIRSEEVFHMPLNSHATGENWHMTRTSWKTGWTYNLGSYVFMKKAKKDLMVSLQFGQ